MKSVIIEEDGIFKGTNKTTILFLIVNNGTTPAFIKHTKSDYYTALYNQRNNRK